MVIFMSSSCKQPSAEAGCHDDVYTNVNKPFVFRSEKKTFECTYFYFGIYSYTGLSIQAGCSFGTDHFKTTKMTLKSPVVNVVFENDQKAAEQELERLRDEQQQQAV
jgi:hypothetical protein